MDFDITTGNSTKSIIGTSDASSTADIAEALAQSLNLAITEDGLPITAVQGTGPLTYRVTVTSTVPGSSYDDTEVGGTWTEGLLFSGGTFTGGSVFEGFFSTYTTGSTPKGQYTKGLGISSPVNIRNIKTTGSAIKNSGQIPLLTGGVNVLGNFSNNYEVVITNDRAATNMDFAFNTENYYTGSLTSGTMPTVWCICRHL